MKKILFILLIGATLYAQTRFTVYDFYNRFYYTKSILDITQDYFNFKKRAKKYTSYGQNNFGAFGYKADLLGTEQGSIGVPTSSGVLDGSLSFSNQVFEYENIFVSFKSLSVSATKETLFSTHTDT